MNKFKKFEREPLKKVQADDSASHPIVKMKELPDVQLQVLDQNGPKNHSPEPENQKSESDFSDGDSKRTKQVNGITEASLKVGAGAVIYLQTLKTLAILFFILMLINIPIYIMYASSTSNNAYTDTEEGLRFFTVGNLGQLNPSCGDLPSFDFSNDDQVLDLRCSVPGQYMTTIKSYGFLQYADPVTKKPSSAAERCSKI